MIICNLLGIISVSSTTTPEEKNNTSMTFWETYQITPQ